MRRLNLCWAHMTEGMFSDFVTQMVLSQWHRHRSNSATDQGVLCLRVIQQLFEKQQQKVKWTCSDFRKRKIRSQWVPICSVNMVNRAGLHLTGDLDWGRSLHYIWSKGSLYSHHTALKTGCSESNKKPVNNWQVLNKQIYTLACSAAYM